MAAREDGFEATLTEVLRDGQEKAATYTHIECKIGGIERAAIADRVLSTWLEHNPQATALYMFVNKADYSIAWEHAGLGQRKTLMTPLENVVCMMTYASWANRRHDPLENRKYVIFLMDMGFGVRTADMTVAALKMLDDMQELLRGRQTGTVITWVSVSYTAQALLSEKAASRLDGLLLPRFGPLMVCNEDREVGKVHDMQRSDNNWQAAAVEWILDECNKDFPKRPTPPAMAFACVMSAEDAYRIRNDLAVYSRLRPVSIHFIQPWVDERIIHEVVSASEELKIICIDHEVSLIPAISNLKAVILAPTFRGSTFGINTTGVVKTKVAYDVASSLAFSLKGFELQNVPHFVFHVAEKFARPQSMVAPNLAGLEKKTEICTASDKDFIYLNLASIVATGYYPHPGILAVVVPLSTPELEEARRRLEVWRLVERTEDSSATHPRFNLTSQLGRALSTYVTKESNIHSLILLGLVKPEMSVPVKQVIVDIAALVSQGLSSFIDFSTTEGQRDHRKTIQSLGDAAGFARKHCHKGLLWQALAYLHCFRTTKRWMERGPAKPPNKFLDEAVRYYKLRQVSRLANYMRSPLNIPYANEAHSLSDEEFPTVEKLVAAAFAFNFMRVPVEQVGYFARDITSDVVLEKEADGEAVDWDLAKKEARQGGDLQVMAIYTHLWMDVVEDDVKVYRAIGTTAISNSAFCNGLMDIGIEHYRSLRPPVRPDRRSLVPRGGS